MAHSATQFSLCVKNLNEPLELASSRSNLPPTFPSRLFKMGCVTVSVALCLACEWSTKCQHIKVDTFLVIFENLCHRISHQRSDHWEATCEQKLLASSFRFCKQREPFSDWWFGHFIPRNFTILGLLNDRFNGDNLVWCHGSTVTPAGTAWLGFCNRLRYKLTICCTWERHRWIDGTR